MKVLLALLKTRFLAMRDGLGWLLLSSVVFPFLLLFFVSRFAPDAAVQTRILSGAVTASVILNAIFLFGQSFAAQRARGEYELYATLPIGKSTFIFGTLLANLTTSLGGALVLIVLAVAVFGFDIQPTLWLLPSLVLGATSVVGIGLVVGVLSRGPGEAALVTNLMVYVLSYATPVFYPLERLPPLLQQVSLYLPTTHAAEAVTASLQGAEAPLEAMVVLLVWTALLFGVVVERLDWRLR